MGQEITQSYFDQIVEYLTRIKEEENERIGIVAGLIAD